MVPVTLAFAGLHARWPTVGFVGWFGPRGLASIVFAIIVVEGAQLPHVELLITIVVVTVALSVLAHGLSAGPLSAAYARWFAGHEEPPPMESAPVHEHRWRRPAAPQALKPGP
jgi:NhaP-type Na+/H+ or K+/H+ antiporter